MGKIARQKEQTQSTTEEREEGRGLGGRKGANVHVLRILRRSQESLCKSIPSWEAAIGGS